MQRHFRRANIDGLTWSVAVALIAGFPFPTAPTMTMTAQRRHLTMTLLWLSLHSFGALAAKDEHTSTLKNQKQIALTIYNQDLALIKDSRSVILEHGENALAWRDVSARIRPETALLRNPAHPGSFSLIEQNFDFDLLTPQKLLEKHVGRKLRIIKTHPASGVETSEEATLLSANGGAVLQFADRVESHPPGRLAYQTLPENLRDRPTLVIRLDAASAGNQELELSYLSGGLSWKADYVGELSTKEDLLALNGWVTLTNQSGASYPNARLQLVAGDVNRVREEIAQYAARTMAMPATAPAPRVSEESLFEYHLYTLDRPTTVADNQTKQVALLSAPQVPVKKEFRLQGADYYYRNSQSELGRKLKVGVFVEFENKGGNLGIPLPKGTLRIYKRDAAGNAQFIGEDRIDHTPKNETVRLKLGDAFDITADKKQTDFQKVGGWSRYTYVYEAAFQIELKNAKNEAVTVKVVEPIPGDWEILTENQPHRKEASNIAVWHMAVPADGKTTLTYRARVKF